jgi:hypothetical protein
MSEQESAQREVQFIREAEIVVGGDRLAQGDLLRPRTHAAFPYSALVVLTADCDIAHGKNNAHLTCLALYRWDQYLTEVYIRSAARRLEHEACAEARRAMRTTESIDYELLLEELVEAPDAVNATLSSFSTDVQNRVSDLAKRIAGLRGLADADSSILLLSEALRHLAADQDRTQTERIARVVKKFCDQIKNGGLPGDTELYESSTDGTACVAYLRTLYDVVATDVVLRPPQGSDEIQRGKFYRSSRLTDRYLYALTRKVGDVFGSIGTPREKSDTQRIHEATSRAAQCSQLLKVSS